MKHLLPTLLILSLLPTLGLRADVTRTLIKESNFVLGEKAPRFRAFQLDGARAGDTLTITITAGDDDVGDRGMTWRVEDNKGRIMGKGFTKDKGRVSWNIAVTSNGPTLILEDRDTNGNGFKLSVTTTSPGKPSKPAAGKYDNYFGGPKAWYDSGNQLGKKDRKAGKKPDPARYKDHYDPITVGEFRRGYMDAYK
jgi:hypothetical protein